MKHIIVHLGPHKTGSSAIQKCLSQNRNSLLAYGVCFLHDSETLEAALSLAKEDFDQAEVQLNSISKQIEQRSEKVFILSQEDFSGDLPGRSPKRRIYPKLTKNLRVIKRSFRPNRVSFVFFVRDEADWLRSCYAQYLRYRTRFHNFEDFSQHYGFPFLWREKLEKSHQTFGDELQVRNYSKEPMAGVDAILQLAGLDERHHLQTSVGASVNSSPSADTIALLEHINRVSEFRPTSWYAKKLVISGWKPNVPRVSQKTKADWPPRVFGQHACALPKLLERTAKRVPKQSVANILPEQMVPLEPLVFDYLPSNVEMPEISRERIEDQSRILTYHLRGKSRLAHLNALVISYLRRATPHTDHARFIFHRIWEEKGAILVNELSTRWLISTLQTFLDHGKNENQRQIGAAGYFYANMMKIYEGERSIEGVRQDSSYIQGTPSTKNEFRGLDRYNVGGTDLMLNTNALALEIALRDDVAGLVLQEFLLRVKSSKNVFSRLDAARVELNMHTDGFLDTWCFFEAPDIYPN